MEKNWLCLKRSARYLGKHSVARTKWLQSSLEVGRMVSKKNVLICKYVCTAIQYYSKRQKNSVLMNNLKSVFCTRTRKSLQFCQKNNRSFENLSQNYSNLKIFSTKAFINFLAYIEPSS